VTTRQPTGYASAPGTVTRGDGGHRP